MSYLQSTLLKDEKIIIEGKLSIWVFLIPLIIAIILFIIIIINYKSSSVGSNAFWIILFIIFLIIVVKNLIKYSTTEIILTNRKFARKTGFLNRNIMELKNEKIEGVSLEQGVLGKILDYGALTVTGTGNTLYYTRWLNSPSLIKEKIYNHIK